MNVIHNPFGIHSQSIGTATQPSMDSDTLHTASTYLNNLLLARGLLKSGKPLDLAKPTRETRAQTINLIHDLLLRRDREQETREHVAHTLRTLRADTTRKDAEIARLHTRLAEKDRMLTQAQVEARNCRAETKKLENGARAAQEQIARLRTGAAQVRAQCVADVRKRDLQIERLTAHVQGQQRGSKRAGWWRLRLRFQEAVGSDTEVIMLLMRGMWVAEGPS